MKKIKALVIAPYPDMAKAFELVKQRYDDIEITIKTGDLFAGQNIAQELAYYNYDVIISRGGTAEMIREAVEVPVVEAPISVYDVLRSIKIAENYTGQFAIAGFASITNCAQLLCDLLQYHIKIVTFQSEKDVLPSLNRLKEEGYSLILCDMIGYTTAKELDLNAILIHSGTESLEASLADAKSLVQATQYVYKQKDLFLAFLTEDDSRFMIYDPSGNLFFSSFPSEPANYQIINLVQSYLKAFINVPGQRIERQIDSTIYTLYSRHLFYDEQKYTAVSIRSKAALTSVENPSITIYNKDDLDSDNILSYYIGTNPAENLGTIISAYSQSTLPVLILGEPGTSKDMAASFLYTNGRLHNSPFYIIDCPIINEKKWGSLFTHESSPLTSINSTIYFKNPGRLSKKQLSRLFLYIEQANLARSNRLIFSLPIDQTESESQALVQDYLENQLKCLKLRLPSLRERPEDIPNIIALYLSRMNASLDRQIVGFEPAAMKALQEFSWPNNLDQFHRVIQELIITAQSPYITESSVLQVLKHEPSLSSPAFSAPLFSLDGTLDDITYRIISTVLKEEGMNKERTARRLGISRSTLWRILKNHADSTTVS